MLSPYKNISIIYGGSGLDCALAIHEEIERLHFEERYPVKSYILAKQILSSANIIETVKDLIGLSSACVVILTFDDVDGERVRQNVLIETGMALMKIDKDNCFFLTNRLPLPADFPSDLKGLVNPNLFDENNLEAVSKAIGQEILSHLGVESNEAVLRNRYYQCDYRAILEDIQPSVFEERYDIQLHSILECWGKHLSSFDFVSERIVYLFERLNFLPIFSQDDEYLHFLDIAKSMVRPAKNDIEVYGAEFLLPVCQVAEAILQYMEAKARCFLDAETDDSVAKKGLVLGQLAEIFGTLRDFADQETFDRYNWMIRAMVCDYKALAAMRILRLDRPRTADQISAIQDVQEGFAGAANIVKRNDSFSRELWDGFLYFNLARAFEFEYKLNGKHDLLDSINNNIERAIVYRKRWTTAGGLSGAFASALSYEYFQACKWKYEFQYEYAEDKTSSATTILQGVSEVRDELDLYCGETEFGRLYAIRDDFDRFTKRLSNLD